jgi:hypothetical protein
MQQNRSTTTIFTITTMSVIIAQAAAAAILASNVDNETSMEAMMTSCLILIRLSISFILQES